MKIDPALLLSLYACASQRNAFASAFPDGLTVTGEPDAGVIARVVKAELDVTWLCEWVLTTAACAAYYEATATACAAYDEATAPARAAYDEATATARAAYDEALASAAWRLLSDDANIRPEYRGWLC